MEVKILLQLKPGLLGSDAKKSYKHVRNMVDKKKLSPNPPRRDIRTKEKEKFAKWVSKEITSREYTDKEMHDIYRLIKQGKQKEAWKILLKGHQCPITCYCQKPAKTWQEKIQKGQYLIQLAEKEGEEAEKIRIREGAELLTKYLNSSK